MERVRNLFRKKEAGIITIFIIVMIVITIGNNAFLNPANIMNILTTNIVMGIAALGMLLVIITGGTDVSIGWVITIVTVVIGEFSTQVGGNLFVLILIACATGAAFGLANGILVAHLKLPAIVATLGTMSIINGLVLLITNGKYIRELPDYISGLGQQYLFKIELAEGGFYGFPAIWLFWIGAIALTWFVLRHTLIGRGIYAVGGNIESAERVGYRPKRVLTFAYVYTGIMAGLAAVVHTGIVRIVDPLAFKGFEMQVIAAVVVGGANVLGGYGTVLGTTVGVIFMGVINNGMVLMHIPTFYQKIAVGLIILIAVSIDVVQQTMKERRMVKVDIKD